MRMNVIEWRKGIRKDRMILDPMILKKYEIMIKWTDNKIGAEGAIKIIESLMMNTALTKLDLSYVMEKGEWM